MNQPPYGLELLAFGPHPDDVELFCGGLLAREVELGHRVGIVDLTRGEKSSRGTPETRAAETAAATRVLGLTVRENLGLPDAWLSPWVGFGEVGFGEVGFGEEEDARRGTPVAKVVEVLRRLRPELVVVPYQRERHPDHEAASALVTRALFFAGVRRFETEAASAPFTPRQVLYYPLRCDAEPTVVVDVTASWPRKLEAIRCYQSQVEPRADAPATLVGSELSLPSLEARDRFYGARIGVAYGEPYVLRETPGLVDPVDHFRRNAFARPLFFPDR
jgi:N-acetylglucosamine malate deacetylase 1